MMVLFLCANATTEEKDSSGYFVCKIKTNDIILLFLTQCDFSASQNLIF